MCHSNTTCRLIVLAAFVLMLTACTDRKAGEDKEVLAATERAKAAEAEVARIRAEERAKAAEAEVARIRTEQLEQKRKTDAGNDFVGDWISNSSTLNIAKLNDGFLLTWNHKSSGVSEKLVGSYSDGKITTTFPMIGPASLVINNSNGELIFSGVGVFKKRY